MMPPGSGVTLAYAGMRYEAKVCVDAVPDAATILGSRGGMPTRCQGISDPAVKARGSAPDYRLHTYNVSICGTSIDDSETVTADLALTVAE
jgi:hypothetical protein